MPSPVQLGRTVVFLKYLVNPHQQLPTTPALLHLFSPAFVSKHVWSWCPCSMCLGHMADSHQCNVGPAPAPTPVPCRDPEVRSHDILPYISRGEVTWPTYCTGLSSKYPQGWHWCCSQGGDHTHRSKLKIQQCLWCGHLKRWFVPEQTCGMETMTCSWLPQCLVQ